MKLKDFINREFLREYMHTMEIQHMVDSVNMQILKIMKEEFKQ